MFDNINEIVKAILLFLPVILILYFWWNGIKLVYNFIKDYFPLIIKWAFFALLLSFSASLFVFVLYHVIYWSAIWLSYIVNYKTINIMIYSTIWVLIYMVWVFLFKQ